MADSLLAPLCHLSKRSNFLQAGSLCENPPALLEFFTLLTLFAFLALPAVFIATSVVNLSFPFFPALPEATEPTELL